jgi:hypothetical protein
VLVAGRELEVEQAAVVTRTPIRATFPNKTGGEAKYLSAFAALKSDGSVVTWGSSVDGGNSSGVASQLRSGVEQIFSTYSAFAALKSDGSVVTWGESSSGGDSSGVASQLRSGVEQIFSTYSAFAALKSDGSVVTWGTDWGGGNSSGEASQLRSGVEQIFSTYFAFAALKSDGSVVTWGESSSGGDSRGVASQLTNVVAFANPFTDDRLVLGGGGGGGPTNTGAAVFSNTGTPIVGNTLTATNSTTDPEGNGAFTHTWQTSTDGSNWNTVGTNSNNYTIARSDQGKQVRLKIDYTDGKGFAESLTTTASQVPSIKTLNKREIRQDIDLNSHQSKTFTFTLPEGYRYEGRFSVDSYDLHFHLRSANGNLVPDSDISISLFGQDGNPKPWEKLVAGGEITVRLESKRDDNLSDLSLYADILSINGKVYGSDSRDVFIRNYSADSAVRASGSPREFQDTWIVSHGWNDRSNNQMFTDLAARIDSEYQGEAILIDWGDAAETPKKGLEGFLAGQTHEAARWIHDVAQFAAHSLVNVWQYRPQGPTKTGLGVIGHSLGAYLSSYLGQLLGDYSNFKAKPDLIR